MRDNEYPNGVGVPVNEDGTYRSGRYYHIPEDNIYQTGTDWTNANETAGTDSNLYSDVNITGKTYKKRKQREKSKSGRKIVLSMCMGMLFGIFAGAGFLVVTATADHTRTEASGSGTEDIYANPDTEGFLNQEGLQEEAEMEQPPASVSEATAQVTAVVTDVTAIVEEVMPAMVSILNEYTEKVSYFGQTYSQSGEASGSGIIIGENETELLLATNYHVIEDTDKLTVTFVDGTEAQAVVKGTDENMDLAVIAILLSDLGPDTGDAITIARMGDSDSLAIGEPAIAIGNALGYGQSVTTGVISAVERYLEMEDGTSIGPFIQTDAAINPGNSGGALLDIKGELVGINSIKIGESRIEGMGYAIPISAARPILDDLMSRETRVKVPEKERGYLGISGISIMEEEAERYGIPEGLYVSRVLENTAAAQAGIKRGDIIVQVGERKISSMDQLIEELEYYRAGDTVTMYIMKMTEEGYQRMTVQVTLGGR